MEVLASRRAQAPLRVGLAVVMSAGFGAMVGWPFALGWVAAGMSAFVMKPVELRELFQA
jgi:hypothetical protein